MPLTECDVYQCVKEGRDNDFWDKVNFVNDMNSSGQFKNLFIKMIAPNPDERYSIKDVMNHDWMKDTNKLFSSKSLKKLEKFENDMNENFKKIINIETTIITAIWTIVNETTFITQIDEEIQKFKEIISDFNISNKNTSDIITKKENIQYQMTTTENQKNNTNKNISTLDLGDCETKLKTVYNID